MKFNNNNNNNNSAREECIICLDQNTQKNRLYQFSNIPSILKTCNCDYSVHLECLNNWLSKNPHCLFCKNSIIKMPGIQNTRIMSLSSPLIDSNDQSQLHYPPPSYNEIVTYRVPEIVVLNNQFTNDRNNDSNSNNNFIIEGIVDDENVDVEIVDNEIVDNEIVDDGCGKNSCILILITTIGIIIWNTC